MYVHIWIWEKLQNFVQQDWRKNQVKTVFPVMVDNNLILSKKKLRNLKTYSNLKRIIQRKLIWAPWELNKLIPIITINGIIYIFKNIFF